MIRETLELILNRLNRHLLNMHPRDENWVILSNVSNQDGRVNDAAKDKLVMFLANISHETHISTFSSTKKKTDNEYFSTRPPVYVNLFILFYANLYDQSYGEGLVIIADTISFFQQNPCFDHDSLPGLAPAIHKLTLAMTNVDLLEINHLMGMMGAKYLPSVYYKLRMLPFDTDVMLAEVPVARGADTSQTPRGGP